MCSCYIMPRFSARCATPSCAGCSSSNSTQWRSYPFFSLGRRFDARAADPATGARVLHYRGLHALNAGGARVSFAEIVTDKGHDAFLLDEPELFAIVRGFLDGAGRARGLA